MELKNSFSKELFSYELVPCLFLNRGDVFRGPNLSSKRAAMFMNYVDCILLMSKHGQRDEAFKLLEKYIKLKYCS